MCQRMGSHFFLMGICRWMGLHFHDWINYNGVVFSRELLEFGILKTIPVIRIYSVKIGRFLLH